MTEVLAPVARQLFLNPSTGAPASGFKIFTYAAGTTTKLATYTDSTGGTPNANPIIADTLGECDIWIPASVSYKFVFSPPTDTDPPTNPIWTRDNIQFPATNAVATLSINGGSLAGGAVLGVNGPVGFSGAITNNLGGFTDNSTTGFIQNSFGVQATFLASGITLSSVNPVAFSVIARTGGVVLNDGATSWSSISDETLKTAISPFNGALDKVARLKAGTGRYLTDGANVSRSFLSAQSVLTVLPEAVSTFNNVANPDDPLNGKLILAYPDVIPLLVAAVQELLAEVADLREAAGLA